MLLIIVLISKALKYRANFRRRSAVKVFWEGFISQLPGNKREGSVGLYCDTWFQRHKFREASCHEWADSNVENTDIRTTSLNVTQTGEAFPLCDRFASLPVSEFIFHKHRWRCDRFFFEHIYLFRYRIQSLSREMVRTAVSRWHIGTMTLETTFFKDKWHRNNNNT